MRRPHYNIGASARAALAVSGGALIIGLAPIGVRLSELGPQATNFWRFVFAIPVLWIAALCVGRPPSRQDASLLGVAGALFGAELSLWVAALTFTTVLNATLFSNLTPIIATAIAFVLFRERLSKNVVLAGAVAILGAALLAISRALDAAGPTGNPRLGLIGDALGIGSAFGYAAYILILRHIGSRVNVVWVMTISTTCAGLYAFIVVNALGEHLWPATLRGWLLLAGLGIGVHIFGQGLIAYGIGRLPVVVSTILLWIQPVTAAYLSWLILGEGIGALGVAGAVLVLLGVYAVQRARATLSEQNERPAETRNG